MIFCDLGTSHNVRTGQVNDRMKRLSVSNVEATNCSTLSLSRASKTIHVDGDRSILKCIECGVVCSNKSGFSRHKCDGKKKPASQVETQVNQEVFKCSQCDKVVKSDIGLKRHISSVHKKKENDAPMLTRSQKKKANAAASQ